VFALEMGVLVRTCGRVVAGKIAVLQPRSRNEDRWPDVAPAARVVRLLSELTGSRKLTAFGGRPGRAGGRCMIAFGVGWR
jgi:hypothetical protein